MVRFLAAAAIVMFAFVCVVLVLRARSGDALSRDRKAAQQQYVRYIRKAQRAAKKNRAEADLYLTMAEEFRKLAAGPSPPPPPE
jgi:hypothetical protein